MSESTRLLLETSRFDVIQHQQERAGRHLVRETVRHPGAVAIVPILEGDRVCLIRNYRISVGATLIELPAGTRDADEQPQQTAIRELEEETGYRAESWQLLARCYMSPGILNEEMHIFLASGLTAGAPAREAGEEIENLIVSWAEALQLIQRAEICDAKTLVGLLSYQQWQRRG